MNIRELAIEDHKAILSDTTSGFAQPLTIINPAGATLVLAGFASDVGKIIDPQTQLEIAGRRATCTFVTQPLTDAGMGTPAAIADGKQKAWRVSFADPIGVVRIYKIVDVAPDHHIGSICCALEAWKA